MTVSDLLAAHGLKTQDDADALLIKLAQDRDALLAALKGAREEVAYMASGMTHADWVTQRAIRSLRVIDSAITQAEATCRTT
ncbi:MAG: hypothetical protein ACKVQA_06905 [Burkholderiales bacterium]